MSQTLATSAPGASRWAQYYALTKPRVVQLIVFCALIGMLLADTGWPDLRRAATATLGIWLVASGLSNIVLGWPLLAALVHTGGAAALVGVLSSLLARATLRRELGRAGDGDFLPFQALVAIHMTHRLFALVATLALLWLVRALWSRPGQRRAALALLMLTLLQVASGLSNVVLGWPLAAALAHTGGAALLVGLLSTLLARAARSRQRS